MSLQIRKPAFLTLNRDYKSILCRFRSFTTPSSKLSYLTPVVEPDAVLFQGEENSTSDVLPYSGSDLISRCSVVGDFTEVQTYKTYLLVLKNIVLQNIALQNILYVFIFFNYICTQNLCKNSQPIPTKMDRLNE